MPPPSQAWVDVLRNRQRQLVLQSDEVQILSPLVLIIMAAGSALSVLSAWLVAMAAREAGRGRQIATLAVATRG